MTGNSRHSDATDQSPGVTIGDVIGGIRGSIIAGRDVILGTSAEQRAQRNRRAMLELVRNTWIKGVLEQSLHGAAMIELGMEERADAVEHPWEMVLQMPDRPNRELPPGTKIVDVFDEMNQSLLILGEPGSGKTTTLLELARGAIARAENDLTRSIPVVFNLSSWAEKRQPLTEWLVEDLNTKYYIPKKVARPWVENDNLLLLLDGLDEVEREYRDTCVDAINKFCQEHLMPLAVCSRTADYQALTTQLKFHGAVLLQPLTSEQIDQYLAGVGTELLAVRTTLRYDPTLQELAQTPLMLSVMTMAYRGMSVEELGSLDSAQARRLHVFGAYVRQMFERRGAKHPYSPEQTVCWLAWLAQKMILHNLSVFLIERMQPDWLEARDLPWLSGNTVRLISVLAGIFVGTLLGIMTTGLSGSICGGVVSSLAGTALAGILVWTMLDLISEFGPRGSIRPAEVIGMSWETLRGRLFYSLFNVLAAGLLGLLGDGIRGALFCLLILGIPGLCIVLPALFKALSVHDIAIREKPNQGIRRSATNAVTLGLTGMTAGLVGGLAIALALGLISESVDLELVKLAGTGLAIGLIGGLGLGLRFGGMAVIKHFFLRLILRRRGHSPWNYARFLDYAVERIFLRRVGGGYIFVHRLLLEHFASKDAVTSCDQGISHYNDGNYGDAILYLTRAVAGITAFDSDQAARIYFFRGDAYARSGDFEKAIVDFNQAIELDSEYEVARKRCAVAYTSRGDTYDELGDLKKAIADYTRAIELDSKYAAAYNSRGNVYVDLGNVKKAISDYTRAIELGPDAVSYSNRGDVYAEIGDLEKAIADYTYAIELDPEDIDTYNLRGIARALVGDYGGATQDLGRCVKLSTGRGPYHQYVFNQEAWIAKLKAGRNPFGEATFGEITGK
jgi:tetratricopeptide (TPR) repeat protein